MDILGTIVKTGIQLKSRRQKSKNSPIEAQMKVLQSLLVKAQNTEFGKTYNFGMMVGLRKAGDPKIKYKQFCRNVPTHNYNQIFDRWWKKTVKGEANVCWPGVTKFFALSSGTSDASTKHIPITKEMFSANQKTSIRQILTLSYFKNLPSDFFVKGILMLGGSTKLNFNGISYEGDLSGIQTSRIPFWFQPFYKPGAKIAQEKDWAKKLDEIVLKAKDWDIGCLAGVPAWIQILLEKIIAHYKLKHIHEIWPNLSVYGHGGVSFDPYRKAFDKLVGKPLIYLENYLASEGFIAYQSRPDTSSMKMAIDNGIFYEFVPFNEENFNADGDMVTNPQTLLIDEIDEGKDYALLISTCAGAWRYLIGDVIRFTSKINAEIIISGRTKHYISLCGEHLSVENMNKAISMVQNDFNVTITEFTVTGIRSGTLFGHQWYISCDDPVDGNALIKAIDDILKILNDDYAVERSHVLREIKCKVLPLSIFHKYLASKGKIGGSHKFPRVLKNQQVDEFEKIINDSLPNV